MAWPDIVVGLLLLFAAFRGWRVGLIGELTGMVAFAVAGVAGFLYPGSADALVRDRTGLGPGSAHVVALFAFAGLAYAFVFFCGFFLGRIAKLPIVGAVNAALGAAFGLVKVTFILWAVLYVALFFPLTPDLRHDLHESRFVAAFEGQNDRLDGALRTAIPQFAQPYSQGIFDRHKV